MTTTTARECMHEKCIPGSIKHNSTFFKSMLEKVKEKDQRGQTNKVYANYLI